MKKKTLVQLRHIADRIPKQCPREIAAFLYSICEEWKFAFFERLPGIYSRWKPCPRHAANHYLWDIKNRQYTLYPL